jgi:YegS/Rv2252/BmrU family lipid kinase
VKILLIVNAAASSVTLRSRVLVQKALSAEHEVQVAETSRRGHAARLAQNAASQGVDLVVVFGGDGTLNEAANGLAGSESALAPLPGGSTNVFARTLGLSDDPVEATAAILDALARGSTRRVGIGSVNRRYFLFHCGVGFDAAVVEQVERRSGLKRYAGHPLFIYAAMDTWLRHYDRKHPHFQVRFDDGSVVDDGYFAICCNTDPYTYLGSRPLHLAPDATLDSPLTMVTIRTLKLRRLGRLAGSALFSGGSKLRRSRHVDYRPDVRAMTVSSDHPFPYQVDGDYLGHVRSLEFRYEPDALRLIVP